MKFALATGSAHTGFHWPGFHPTALLALWWRRARERNELMQMNDHDLHDLALTRSDVQRESSKPFWKE
jgi:uncharacterized protein YjiS (DUF1127 family)